MKRFCKENPVERIGYQKDGVHDIRKHRWFQGFDWEGLATRSLTPPIAPSVQSAADTSNFDKYPRDEAVPADELSGWDKEFWIYTSGANIYQWSATQQLHSVPCLLAEVILFLERGMKIDITVQVNGV